MNGTKSPFLLVGKFWVMKTLTTPTLTITLDGVLVDNLGSIYVTFEQNDKELTKTNDAMVKDIENNTISIAFTQEDTLFFSQGRVDCQLRALLKDGTTAIASKINSFTVEKVLLDGVIVAKEE